MKIEYVDEKLGVVHYNDGSTLDHKGFMKHMAEFFQGRIAGETLVPTDMEHFMRRTSGKTLELLMKGKKYEGYMEGVSDKLLTKGQKIAVTTVATLVVVGLIVIVVLNNEGMI